MLVFFKENLVFLSVPKTGSTSVHAALADRADLVISGPPELKHAPLYRYNRFIRPMYEKVCSAKLDTLAVMREPVSWLGSWFRYRQRPFLNGKPTSTAGISFEDFVSAYIAPDQEPFANVGSQYKFLEARPNGTKVDHLFAYEDPEPLVEFLEQRLGQAIDLPVTNVSGNADLLLSDRAESRLRRKYARDFDLYDSIRR